MTIIFFHHITTRVNIGNFTQKPIFEISPKNGKFYPKMEKINSFFEGKSFNTTNSQSGCLS
jgi:hypothetical protein